MAESGRIYVLAKFSFIFFSLCGATNQSFFFPSIKGKIFRSMGHKSHLCSKYLLNSMIKISLALRVPGKTQSVFFWLDLGQCPSGPVILSPPGRGTSSVQYVQYCLAAVSFLTRVSCTCELAAGGPGPRNTVWVEFSTRCLIWPRPRGVLPDLQTPIRIHSFLDGKYFSCCCQRTLIFDCKPGGMSVGQTKVSRSQIFLCEGHVCSGWYLF